MWRSLLVADEELVGRQEIARKEDGSKMVAEPWATNAAGRAGSASHHELRPAARVHPDPAVVVTPRPIQDAAAAAELTSELDAEARIGLAEMTRITLGFANEDVPIEALVAMPSAPLVAHEELRGAAAIDPDALAVITPRPPLDARSAAELPAQLHAEAGAGRAADEAAIRSADDQLVATLLATIIERSKPCG